MRQTSPVKSAVKSTTSKKRLEIPLPQQTENSGDFNQKVAQKAYELYVARGCAHGYDVEDWITAEEIVRGS